MVNINFKIKKRVSENVKKRKGEKVKKKRKSEKEKQVKRETKNKERYCNIFFIFGLFGGNAVAP